MDKYSQSSSSNSSKYDDEKREKRNRNVKECRERKKVEYMQKEQQLRDLQSKNANLVKTVQWQYNRQSEVMNQLQQKYHQNPSSFTAEETKFIFKS